MTFPPLNPRDPRAHRTLRARQYILRLRYQRLDLWWSLTAHLVKRMVEIGDRFEAQLWRDGDRLMRDAELVARSRGG